MTEVLNTSVPAEETPAEETVEQRLARLETLIQTNQTKGWQAVVETADGPKTVREITKEVDKYLEEMALQTAELKRSNDEYEARNPIPYATPSGQLEWRSQHTVEPRLYGTEEAAEAFVGRNKWNSFNAEQKAQLRTIRPSDLEKLDATVYFGKGSSSLKATRLMKENPGLYFALKAKAKKDGSI